MPTQNNNNDAPQSPPRYERLDIFRANTPTEPHGLPLAQNMTGFNWVSIKPEPSFPSETIIKVEEEEEFSPSETIIKVEEEESSPSETIIKVEEEKESSPSKTIIKVEEEEEEKPWLHFGPRPDIPNFGAWKMPDWQQGPPQLRERTPVSPKTVGKCRLKLNLPKQPEVRKCRLKLNLPLRPVEPHISKPSRRTKAKVKKEKGEEKEKRKRPKLTLKLRDPPKPRPRLVLRLMDPETGEFVS